MHVMVNMHVTLLLHECYMHVVRVLEMVAHVPCMLYECRVTCMLVVHVTCMLYEGCNTIGAHLLTSQYVGKGHHTMIFIYQ